MSAKMVSHKTVEIKTFLCIRWLPTPTNLKPCEITGDIENHENICTQNNWLIHYTVTNYHSIKTCHCHHQFLLTGTHHQIPFVLALRGIHQVEMPRHMQKTWCTEINHKLYRRNGIYVDCPYWKKEQERNGYAWTKLEFGNLIGKLLATKL